MVNMSVDIANNLLAFISSLVALVGVLVSLVYGYAHLQGRVATLEERAERAEREHREFKTAMEQETKRIELKLENVQVGINQVLEVLAALKAEMRIRFERGSHV